jgi:hypothetical protein
MEMAALAIALDRLPSDRERWQAILRLRRAVARHDSNGIRAAQAGFPDCFEGAGALLSSEDGASAAGPSASDMM